MTMLGELANRLMLYRLSKSVQHMGVLSIFNKKLNINRRPKLVSMKFDF